MELDWKRRTFEVTSFGDSFAHKDAAIDELRRMSFDQIRAMLAEALTVVPGFDGTLPD